MVFSHIVKSEAVLALHIEMKTPLVVHEASWKNNKESGSMESTQLSIDRRKNRIEYIDLLKCFGIYCVLWTHSLGDVRTGWFFLSDPLHKFIVTFNMPLFFMVSGFFFGSSFDLSFKDFLRKKAAVLLIPHLAWSILISLMNWGMTFLGWRMPFVGESSQITFLSQLQALIRPDPATELWFFKDLFLTSLIVFTTCKIFKKRSRAFIASMFFVLLVDCFGIVGKVQRFMMPIFWAGILLKAYYPIFCKHLNKFLIGTTVAFAVCFYFYDYTYMIYLMDFPVLINFQQSLTEGKIIFDFTNIGISVFRSLTGIVGSIFFFALFQRCWKQNAVTSFLSHSGQVLIFS
jgi:fucose 4-O-acetylase-like acetyltransferase